MRPQIYFCKNSLPIMAVLMFCLSNAQTTRMYSNDSDLIIPDNFTLVSTPLVVDYIPSDAHIYHINVGFRANHTWVGDLAMSLQLPNGFNLGLMHRPGTNDVSSGFGGNQANLNSNNMILFEDYAATSSESIGYNLGIDDIIPAGAFKPSWNTNDTTPAFTSFTDIAQQYTGTKTGSWLLHVTDKMAGDTGTLTYAEMTIKYDNYCIPFLLSDFENISNVSFAGLNYNSGVFEYLYPDYQTVALTDDSYSVNRGQNYPLSVTINPQTKEYIYAFIDWNQDKDFSDANETYTVASNVNTAGPHSLNITVPDDAVLGETRMRVMLDYNQSIANPCRSLAFGETEDFTLLIQPRLGTDEADAQLKTIAYPNPITDAVKFISKNTIKEVTIFNGTGQKVLIKMASAKELILNMSNLTTGVYLAKIETDKGFETIKLIKK